MKQNKDTLIRGEKVTLVPYKKEHVLKYHAWMQSAELQELTASEPLTLEQEYAMQRAWFSDEDKCTFIVLDAEIFERTGSETGSMVGDVNLFLNDPDDRAAAEVEVMIAEPSCRGKGFGQEATLAIMKYGIDCLNIKEYSVKIGFSNTKSIALFNKLGFKEVSRSDVFEELTMNLPVSDDELSRLHAMTLQTRVTRVDTPS